MTSVQVMASDPALIDTPLGRSRRLAPPDRHRGFQSDVFRVGDILVMATPQPALV